MLILCLALVACGTVALGVAAHYAAPAHDMDRGWMLGRETIGVLVAMGGNTLAALTLYLGRCAPAEVLWGVALCWCGFAVVGVVALVTNFCDARREREFDLSELRQLRAENERLRRESVGRTEEI